jgi:hypothetical protein
LTKKQDKGQDKYYKKLVMMKQLELEKSQLLVQQYEKEVSYIKDIVSFIKK